MAAARSTGGAVDGSAGGGAGLRAQPEGAAASKPTTEQPSSNDRSFMLRLLASVVGYWAADLNCFKPLPMTSLL
ncbi:MAG: hypothetical protein JWP01_2156 [Myxococcales bacterium]|nr:hypothetical protein [Myxococcales bacterium]